MGVKPYLREHEHYVVTKGSRSWCPECLRQYEQREAILAQCGYAVGVITLFTNLVGKQIRYKQCEDGAYGYGTVLDWEYPNCCLLIRHADWMPDRFCRQSWLRFGWCGMLSEGIELKPH